MRVAVWLAAGALALGPALLVPAPAFAAPSATECVSDPASAAPAAASAQTASTPAQSEITVYARTQEKTKDRIFLAGDVEVRYNDLRLFADRVELDPKTKDCIATGNVTVQLPNESVTAEEVLSTSKRKWGRWSRRTASSSRRSSITPLRSSASRETSTSSSRPR